jgi:hypothetical protein
MKKYSGKYYLVYKDSDDDSGGYKDEVYYYALIHYVDLEKQCYIYYSDFPDDMFTFVNLDDLEDYIDTEMMDGRGKFIPEEDIPLKEKAIMKLQVIK